VDAAPFYELGYTRWFTQSELPAHPVTITRPFAIGKYLVTRGEFAAFVRETGDSGAGGCFGAGKVKQIAREGWEKPGFAQTDRDPVVCVTWWDAKSYVTWLNKRLAGSAPGSAPASGPYRLPSEAEWEYAARAGTQTARWWGEAIGADNADCHRCGSQWDNKQTAPVGSFRANPFGLYDMLGNAWEWTADCWNGTYAGARGDGTPWMAGDCTARVIRGGGWQIDAQLLRAPVRSKSGTENAANYIGFRVVRTIP
jgi:formylglycine-generating enzyme required for sulfatase activity